MNKKYYNVVKLKLVGITCHYKHDKSKCDFVDRGYDWNGVNLMSSDLYIACPKCDNNLYSDEKIQKAKKWHKRIEKVNKTLNKFLPEGILKFLAKFEFTFKKSMM